MSDPAAERERMRLRDRASPCRARDPAQANWRAKKVETAKLKHWRQMELVCFRAQRSLRLRSEGQWL